MKCDICKQDFKKWELEPLNIGRKNLWLCKDCYKSGDIDARYREVMRGDRARKGWKK